MLVDLVDAQPDQREEPQLALLSLNNCWWPPRTPHGSVCDGSILSDPNSPSLLKAGARHQRIMIGPDLSCGSLKTLLLSLGSLQPVLTASS